MSSSILQDKGFRKESDTVAIAARVLIARVRRHIEQDNCACCRQAIGARDDKTNKDGSHPAFRR